MFVDALWADVPGTGVEPAANEKPTVAACTASENVAVGATDVATPVAPAAGVDTVTVGGVVSTGGAAAVVNDHVTGAAIGCRPCPAPRLIVAVYVVDVANAADGVNVAVFEPTRCTPTSPPPASNQPPTRTRPSPPAPPPRTSPSEPPTSRHPSHPPPASIAVTVGGVVSTGGAPVLNTTSTQ